jgi:predicted peptidase
MNRKHALILLLAAVATAPPSVRAANLADFTDYSLRTVAGLTVLPGRLYIPPEAASDLATPRPLMVYLHGGGAIGTDNVTQILHTPDYMVEEAKLRGAFLYVPQTPTGWSSLTSINAAMTMINRAVADLHADDDRLYAAGYSNGGGGVWNLLNGNRDRFAAAFTLSAVAPAPGFAAGNLVDTPIFAMHARDDASVPVARTREVVSAILTAAGHARPAYPSLRSPLELIVANPVLPFHQAVLANATPDVATVFPISNGDLDLLYYEAREGGHTGLLGIFYVPPIYDWMFQHSLVPEPSAALLVCCVFPFWLRRRGQRFSLPRRLSGRAG